MDLKAFRRSRLRAAMQELGTQVLVASLPQNITYVTNGYVSVNQFVLCSTQSYVVYHPAEERLIYVVGHGEIPSILEFDGEDAMGRSVFPMIRIFQNSSATAGMKRRPAVTLSRRCARHCSVS